MNRPQRRPRPGTLLHPPNRHVGHHQGGKSAAQSRQIRAKGAPATPAALRIAGTPTLQSKPRSRRRRKTRTRNKTRRTAHDNSEKALRIRAPGDSGLPAQTHKSSRIRRRARALVRAVLFITFAWHITSQKKRQTRGHTGCSRKSGSRLACSIRFNTLPKRTQKSHTDMPISAKRITRKAITFVSCMATRERY